MQSRRPSKLKRKVPKALPLDPPNLGSQFFMRVVFRYQSIAAVTQNTVNWRSLCNLLMMSTSTTAGYVVYTAYRPKSVTIWAPAVSAAGASTPLALYFTGGVLTEDAAQPLLADRKVYTDVPTTERGAVVRAKFDKPLRTYDVYQTANLTNTPTLFQYSCPIGSIVDLDMVIKIFGDDRTTLPKTITMVAGTSQVPYWNYLDNLNGTGAAGQLNLKPIDTILANVIAFL